MQSVLAVDDSASMRGLVTYVLEQAGFEVFLAEDGMAALEYARAQTVDLVLTDINMPNLDGIALIKQLRALPHYKFVPMLVLTTESGTAMKMEGKAAGATGWIVKPFDPDQLVSTITNVLACFIAPQTTLRLAPTLRPIPGSLGLTMALDIDMMEIAQLFIEEQGRRPFHLAGAISSETRRRAGVQDAKGAWIQ